MSRYYIDNTTAGQFYDVHMQLVDNELGYSPYNEDCRSRIHDFIMDIWMQHSHENCFWVDWQYLSLIVMDGIKKLVTKIKARNVKYQKQLLDAASNRYGYSLQLECLLEFVDTERMDYVEAVKETLRSALDYPELNFYL